MKLALQIVSWVMLVIGVIADIGLLAQADSGTIGEAPGIVVASIWVAQSVLTLVFINQYSFEGEK